MRLAAVILAALLSACASKPVTPDPPRSAAARPGTSADIDYVPSVPARRQSRPRSTLVAPPSLSGIAVVLSGQQSAYAAVAADLAPQLQEPRIYELDGSPVAAENQFRQIADGDLEAVVAIGLAAARAAVRYATVPVVFCQVFNYSEPGLLSDTSRAVAALVPLEMQLDAWTRSEPGLGRVGVILGTGQDDLVKEAVAAAENHGIELTVVVVASDLEAQYQFRRIVEHIDGLWLFPDSRILSARVLREILDQAKRREVGVAVSNENLLGLGASISIASDPADVAATVVEVLRRVEADGLAAVPPVTPLNAAQVVTR
jgi:ABC-type uncharacterized transport system substrate-binding protein